MARFEAYEQVRRERRRTDELTEASEKLAAPMANTFEYQLGSDGELYFQGQSLKEVFETGLMIAKELVKNQPQFSVELLRRYIELDEYGAMTTLARATGEAPDVLVVLSPIPDAVVNGVELGAYDLSRRKTMARVFERTDDGIRATSVSLDRTDRDGLQAIAAMFGETLREDEGSEDILRHRLWGWRDELSSAPFRSVRETYDAVLTRKYGGRWFGGRQDAKELSALDFIEKQTDLIAAHEEVLDTLEKRKAPATDFEKARYDFAAALSRRLRGDADSASLSEAGAAARERGEKYDSDCPTGVDAPQSLESLGYRVWQKGHCRACRQETMVGECSVCVSCEEAHNAGGDEALKRIMRRAHSPVHQERRPLTPRAEVKKAPTASQLKRQFGEYAVRRTLVTFGGAERVVVDWRTHEVLAQV